MKNIFALLFFFTIVLSTYSQTNPKLRTKLDQQAKAIEPKVIEWRRHFHQFPELSNREINTGAAIAEYLKGLGLEIQYPVAKTGVVAILRTGKSGPVIALRADIDALPVTEKDNLPFASREKVNYNGQETGVMHACGHDAHIAMLMGVATILVKNKSELKGTIKFLFQPAEELAPTGEEGGAQLMVKEGVLDNPKVDAIFGLHIQSMRPVGTIGYRSGGMMASLDNFSIIVKGRQSHGAAPWMGIDPIVIGAQIVSGLQTIVSRQMDLTNEAAVVTVGKFHSGIRENIIPEDAVMSGTIRTLDAKMREAIQEKVKLIATKIAEGGGATAEVTIRRGPPVTYNDPALTTKMVASLGKAAGDKNVVNINGDTGTEDFSYYQEKVPGLYFFVGGMPPGTDREKVASHHTPEFFIDESGFLVGMKAMLYVAVDYLNMPQK